MDDTTIRSCQRTCWMIAALGGVGLALLLSLVWSLPFGGAMLAGLIFFAVLDQILRRVSCKTNMPTGGAAVPQADAAPAPPPRPVDPVRPEAADPVPARVTPHPPVVALAPSSGEVVEAPPPAMKPARVKAAAKPVAKKADAAKKPVAKAKAVKPTDADAAGADHPGAPRASGLAAAMGRTKEAAADAPSEPLLLLAPREGGADDLKLIRGIGPALERLLNDVGVWHFDQIASWKARDIAFVDDKMPTFKGRITRDEWVKQARALARSGGAV